MFSGEYLNSIDAKGRMIVPSKLRDGLGDKFMVTKGLEKCVLLMTMDNFEKIADKIMQSSLTNIDAQALARFFIGGAVEGEFDSQGRILMPQNLREYAGMVKEIKTIGILNRIEIWDKTIYEEYSNLNFTPDAFKERFANFMI